MIQKPRTSAAVVFAALCSSIAQSQSQSLPGMFIQTGSMSRQRVNHTATLLPNGKVLIAGGTLSFSINGNSVSATAELYDPSTGTFTPTGSMTSPGGCSATLLADGRVLVAECAVPPNSAVAELYDPTVGRVATIGTPPYPPDSERGLAEVLFFGKAPGYAGLNQVNVRVPGGVVVGDEVPVLDYLSRPSNEVTTSVR